MCGLNVAPIYALCIIIFFMLFRVNRFELALNILKQIYVVSTFGMLHLN